MSLILVRLLHYVKRDVIHKTGSTLHIALASEEDRAMATGNMYRKFVEKLCVWLLRLRILLEGEVK